MHPQPRRAGEQVGGHPALGELDRHDRAEAGVADHADGGVLRAAGGRARARWPARGRAAPRGSADHAGPATPRTGPGALPTRSRRFLSTSYSSSDRVTTAPMSDVAVAGDELRRRVHDQVRVERRAAAGAAGVAKVLSTTT